MAGSNIDLQGSLRGDVSVKPEEHPDERSVRLEAERRGSFIEDCKGIAIFVVVLVAIVVVGGLAAYEGIFDPTASPETKRWGQLILSSLLSGGFSFVLGRKVGK